jgi:hypothetical protein
MQKNEGMFFYVKANGDDRNDGFSVKKPFKTLAHAVAMAKYQGIQTIVISGTLDEKSESAPGTTSLNDVDSKSVFYLKDSGKDPITIIGRNHAQLRGKYAHADFNKNSLSTDAKRVIRVAGNSNIIFKNIVITGGYADSIAGNGMALAEGGGILVTANATITLGEGAVIKHNYAILRGGAVAVIAGTLILEGGQIFDNSARYYDGGGISIAPRRFPVVNGKYIDDPLSESSDCVPIPNKFVMRNGKIFNNIAFRGGAICIHEGAVVEINGGIIKDNHACYGAGVYVSNGGICHMSNGVISGNKADKKSDTDFIYLPIMLYHGGGIFIDGGLFDMTGGIIKDNKARKGGGVYLGERPYDRGKFIISNRGIIKNNKAYEGNDIWFFTETNLFVKKDDKPDAFDIFYATDEFLEKQFAESRELFIKSRKEWLYKQAATHGKDDPFPVIP